MPQIILPVALVDVATREDHLPLPVLEALRDAAVVDFAGHLAQLIVRIVQELMPMQGHAFR